MNRIRFASAIMIVSVALGCFAGSKNKGEFVLVDGQRTRLPIMVCKVPNDCVVLGKVIWNQNVSDPIRYHTVAVGTKDGSKSTVSGGFLVKQRNIMAMPAQCPEVFQPNLIAQYASGEICGIYGLQNLRVLKAEAIPVSKEMSNAYANTFVVGAQRAGLTFSNAWVQEMHFRYSGTLNGHPMVINAIFPYFFFVNGGRFANGMVIELATTCSTEANEQLALNRLAVMRKSRVINMAFSKKLDEIIAGGTVNWIKSNNQMVQEMMRINQDLERSYASYRDATWYSSEVRSRAVNSFCDAIRGEERVSNPLTGRDTYISTEYDHCAVNGFGDQLYWNGSGSTANFDPNANLNFNGIRWSNVK